MVLQWYYVYFAKEQRDIGIAIKINSYQLHRCICVLTLKWLFVFSVQIYTNEKETKEKKWEKKTFDSLAAAIYRMDKIATIRVFSWEYVCIWKCGLWQ